MNKSAEGVQLFGSSFGQNTSSTNIFGGTPTSTTKSETSTTTTPVSSSITTTPAFGSTGSGNIFGGLGNTTSTPTFGSLSTSTNVISGFSFADAAKGFDKKSSTAEPDLLKKMETGVSFASLATGTSGNFLTKQSAPNSGFVGLTVKEDIFTRMANKSKNDSTGENDDKEEAAGGDENYDPHYEPIIQLPDEIEVRTGEEDETKLFGDRAKLYRFDADTKEWKERGKRETVQRKISNDIVTIEIHIIYSSQVSVS